MAQKATIPMMRKGANVPAPRTRRVDMTPSKVMVTRSPRHEAIGGAILSEDGISQSSQRDAGNVSGTRVTTQLSAKDDKETHERA